MSRGEGESGTTRDSRFWSPHDNPTRTPPTCVFPDGHPPAQGFHRRFFQTPGSSPWVMDDRRPGSKWPRSKPDILVTMVVSSGGYYNLFSIVDDFAKSDEGTFCDPANSIPMEMILYSRGGPLYVLSMLPLRQLPITFKRGRKGSLK